MRKVTFIANAALVFVVSLVLKILHIYNCNLIFQIFLVMSFALVSLYTFLVYKLPEKLKKLHLEFQIIAITFMIISIIFIAINKDESMDEKIKSSYIIFNIFLPILIDFIRRKLKKTMISTIRV